MARPKGKDGALTEACRFQSTAPLPDDVAWDLQWVIRAQPGEKWLGLMGLIGWVVRRCLWWMESVGVVRGEINKDGNLYGQKGTIYSIGSVNRNI